jgi:AcrR family transcriptional regulator
MSTSSAPYHHGDLRAACLRAAMELLEESGATALSLRAVARRAGELAGYLATAHPSPSTPDDLAAVAVAYVQFALQRPALFRVMFGEPCDPDSNERVAAVTAISEYVGAIVRRCFADSDPEALSTAIWALVHGLAFLHLDGKLDTSSPAVVSDRVRAAVHAVLTASNATSQV